jgi:hypothetical protein
VLEEYKHWLIMALTIMKWHFIEVNKVRWVLVAHAYNPSYSGGRDQDGGSKSAPGKWLVRLYLKKKNLSQKRAGGKSTCLASMGPWVQTPRSPKKKVNKVKVYEFSL